jgi:hypothetical protein
MLIIFSLMLVFYLEALSEIYIYIYARPMTSFVLRSKSIKIEINGRKCCNKDSSQ